MVPRHWIIMILLYVSGHWRLLLRSSWCFHSLDLLHASYLYSSPWLSDYKADTRYKSLLQGYHCNHIFNNWKDDTINHLVPLKSFQGFCLFSFWDEKSRLSHNLDYEVESEEGRPPSFSFLSSSLLISYRLRDLGLQTFVFASLIRESGGWGVVDKGQQICLQSEAAEDTGRSNRHVPMCFADSAQTELTFSQAIFGQICLIGKRLKSWGGGRGIANDLSSSEADLDSGVSEIWLQVRGLRHIYLKLTKVKV